MTVKLIAELAAACALLAIPLSAAAEPFASEAARASHSSARLLAEAGPSGGVYRAGVEIALAPRTITYWRQPGDSGAPPVFDFAGSENLAAAEVSYPVPKHIDEAGLIVAGYDESVVFPLRVTPKDSEQARGVEARARLCGLRRNLPSRQGETVAVAADGGRVPLCRTARRRAGAKFPRRSARPRRAG